MGPGSHPRLKRTIHGYKISTAATTPSVHAQLKLVFFQTPCGEFTKAQPQLRAVISESYTREGMMPPISDEQVILANQMLLTIRQNTC